MDGSNIAMIALNIPFEISDDIRSYLLGSHDNKQEQKEVKEFFDTMKPTLKKKVNMYIFF